MHKHSIKIIFLLLLGLAYACQQNKPVESEAEESQEIEIQQPNSNGYQL